MATVSSRKKRHRLKPEMKISPALKEGIKALIAEYAKAGASPNAVARYLDRQESKGLKTIAEVAKTFKLDKVLENQSATVKEAILSQVLTGRADPDLIRIFSTLAVDPNARSRLLRKLSHPKALELLRMLSLAKVNGGFTPEMIQEHMLNRENQHVLEELSMQYAAHGIKGIDYSKLLALINSLDFEGAFEDTRPVRKLLAGSAQSRNLDSGSVKKAFEAIAKAELNRKTRLREEKKLLESMPWSQG